MGGKHNDAGVAITPRSMTPLIQSHLGIGRYAAGEDCSMSTWKYRQFECRGPVKHPLSGRRSRSGNQPELMPDEVFHAAFAALGKTTARD
jgi:hypothetical protein